MSAVVQLGERQIRQIIKQHVDETDYDEAVGLMEFMTFIIKAKYPRDPDWKAVYRPVRRMADKKRARSREGASNADN